MLCRSDGTSHPFLVFPSSPHEAHATCPGFPQQDDDLCQHQVSLPLLWPVTSATSTTLGPLQTSAWHRLSHKEQLLQMFSVLSFNPLCSSPLPGHTSTCRDTWTERSTAGQRALRVPSLKAGPAFLSPSSCMLLFFPDLICKLSTAPLTKFFSSAFPLHLTGGAGSIPRGTMLPTSMHSQRTGRQGFQVQLLPQQENRDRTCKNRVPSVILSKTGNKNNYLYHISSFGLLCNNFFTAPLCVCAQTCLLSTWQSLAEVALHNYGAGGSSMGGKIAGQGRTWLKQALGFPAQGRFSPDAMRFSVQCRRLFDVHTRDSHISKT